MGSNEGRFLQWNTHSDTIMDGVKAAHGSAKYSDVTILAGGEFFPAHRVILGACSDVFDSMFSYGDNTRPFIVLDQSARHIRWLLSYIYKGEVQMEIEEMATFFRVAQLLKVRGLYLADDADPLLVEGDADPLLVEKDTGPPLVEDAGPPLVDDAVPPSPTTLETTQFQEKLRLSLAQAEYLSSKYSPKSIPSVTIASPTAAATPLPPSTIATTVSAVQNPVNLAVTNPFGFDVVTNQLFGGANLAVRGALNALHLKPTLGDKKSPIRNTHPPLKRKRTHHPSTDSEHQAPPPKPKNAKTRSNPPSRVSPVNTFPAHAPTTTTTATTATVLPAEQLLHKLESHAKLQSESTSLDQVGAERPASPAGLLPVAVASSAVVEGDAAAGSDDTTNQASSDAFAMMPNVKVEMNDERDEQIQLQLDEVQRKECDQMEAKLQAKIEPDDSDDQRELLVDDSAAADGVDDAGHEGRSSSSSSSHGCFGDATAPGSSVQDFLQAELQPQDDDASGDDMPALVMNVADENEFKCTECNMVLANMNLLRRHLNDKHKQVRKHFCEYCEKSFKRKEHLDRHIRIHTGSKPFACEICQVRFTQKEHLKGHVENVHEKLGKKSARNKANKSRSRTTSPKIQGKKIISKLANGTALAQGASGMYSIALVNNEGTAGCSSNLHNGGIIDRMVSGEATGSGSIGDSMSANLSNALSRMVASQACSGNSGAGLVEISGEQEQKHLALICSSSGNSNSPPQLTSPPAFAQAPSHPLHSTSSSRLVHQQQSSSQFRPISRPYAGPIVPSSGLVSILTLPNINNGGSGGPPTTSFMPFNPIPLTTKNIIASLSNSAFHANLPNTRFSSSSPTLESSSDDVPSISISNDNGLSPSDLSSDSPVSSVKQITVVAGASGHVEAVVSPTRSARRGRGRGRGGLGRGSSTSITGPFGRGSPSGAKIALEKTKRLINVFSGGACATDNPTAGAAAAKEVTNAAAAEEAKAASSGSSADLSSSSLQQLTAVYAPVTRNSVTSPEKHMKTVVLNIP